MTETYLCSGSKYYSSSSSSGEPVTFQHERRLIKLPPCLRSPFMIPGNKKEFHCKPEANRLYASMILHARISADESKDTDIRYQTCLITTVTNVCSRHLNAFGLLFCLFIFNRLAFFCFQPKNHWLQWIWCHPEGTCRLNEGWGCRSFARVRSWHRVYNAEFACGLKEGRHASLILGKSFAYKLFYLYVFFCIFSSFFCAI